MKIKSGRKSIAKLIIEAARIFSLSADLMESMMLLSPFS
jgi:hypothetical protein